MQTKILRYGLWVAAGIATIFLLLVWCDVYGWSPIPEIRGRIKARIDVAHGRYRELGYGLPVPWLPAYESLLRKRYGVEFEAVSGCIVWKSLENYVAAYNGVSETAANRKFGHDIFKEVSEEARKTWELDRQLKTPIASQRFSSTSPSGSAISTRFADKSTRRRYSFANGIRISSSRAC